MDLLGYEEEAEEEEDQVWLLFNLKVCKVHSKLIHCRFVDSCTEFAMIIPDFRDICVVSFYTKLSLSTMAQSYLKWGGANVVTSFHFVV